MSTRHRFVPVVSTATMPTGAGYPKVGLCGWVFPGGTVRCALPYLSEWHYTDNDHPFVPGGTEGCYWEMQGAPLVGLCGKAQYVMEHQTDHNSGEYPVIDRDPATVKFEYPLMEPAGRMFGTPQEAALPAEEGGVDGDPWAAGITKNPSFVGFVAGAAHEPEPLLEEDPPYWEQAADALERGDVVGSGPWPVRQFFWGAGHAGMAAAEVTKALALIGEPFMLCTWWADVDRHLVRVQWGELLGASPDVTVDRVRRWNKPL